MENKDTVNTEKVLRLLRELVDKTQFSEGRCSFCGNYVMMASIPSEDIKVELRGEDLKDG